MTTQEFIDAIKSMTVLELNDLVKACEEEFGVLLMLLKELMMGLILQDIWTLHLNSLKTIHPLKLFQ